MTDTLLCPACREKVALTAAVENGFLCGACGGYLRVPPRERVKMVFDDASFTELFSEVRSVDFLHFPGYSEKLEKSRADTDENSAVLTGTAALDGRAWALFIMDARFIMGSMGSAVGEKITRIFDYAAERRLPVIGFTASGGARMQEGIVSLMQMAKSSGAVGVHGEAGNLYVTVLTDPTTGGMTASVAMQGDITLAEPKALVGFAGRRVVEQTTGSALPEDFQSAEFLLSHGFVDQIVPREQLREVLSRILMLHDTNGGKA